MAFASLSPCHAKFKTFEVPNETGRMKAAQSACSLHRTIRQKEKINQAFVKRCGLIITSDRGEFSNVRRFSTAFAQSIGGLLPLLKNRHADLFMQVSDGILGAKFRVGLPDAGRTCSDLKFWLAAEPGRDSLRFPSQCKVFLIIVFSIAGLPNK